MPAPALHTPVEAGADQGVSMPCGCWVASALTNSSTNACEAASRGTTITPGLVQNGQPKSNGSRQRLRQLRPLRRQHRGRRHDRVDGTQLTEEQDRPRSLLRHPFQRTAAAKGAGESDRRDLRRLDQPHTDLDARAFDHAEDACGQACCFTTPCASFMTSRESPGWPGCALTTTVQPAASAAAVSPPSTGERERKVAGTEHRHRPQRHAHARQARAARRRCSGHGLVLGEGEGVALLGACRRSLRSWNAVRSSSPFRRPGPSPVSPSASGTSRSRALECIGQAAQQPGAGCAAARGPGRGGVGGVARGGVDLFGRAVVGRGHIEFDSWLRLLDEGLRAQMA